MGFLELKLPFLSSQVCSLNIKTKFPTPASLQGETSPQPYTLSLECPDLEILSSLNLCLPESLTWCFVTFRRAKEKAKPAVTKNQRLCHSSFSAIISCRADLDPQDLKTPQIFLKLCINHYTAVIFQMKTSDFIPHAFIHLFFILLWKKHCFPIGEGGLRDVAGMSLMPWSPLCDPAPQGQQDRIA